MRTIVILLYASLASAQAPKVIPAPPQGRFQLVHLGSMREDQYLLDTLLGRVWKIVVTPKGQNLLEPIQFWDPALGEIAYPLPDDAVADYQRNIVATRKAAIKASTK